MIGALLYLQLHSLRNRIRTRLRRLKRPRYLVGAIAGGLYFYFFFLRQWVSTPNSHAGARSILPGHLTAAFESFAAMGLLALCVVAWLWPHKRTALEFTEAEVAFLFPAPVTRRTLVHFKLMKSQAAILLSGCFMALFSGPLAHGGLASARFLAAWWVLLSTVNLHLLGCSFAQTRLLDRGLSSRKLRLGILAAVIALVSVSLAWTARTLPPFDLQAMTRLDRLTDYGRQAAAAGPLPWLLYPFRLVLRPMLAADFTAFWRAVGPALGVMTLHYWWVTTSDVAFEEASVEASRKLAERIASLRAGKVPFAAARSKRRRSPPFRLRPTGPRLVALLWKNLIAAGDVISSRLWFTGLLLLLVATLVIAPTFRDHDLAVVIGGFALGLCGMLLVIGPQILRMDLRQDLPVADILKMYPWRGWEVVLGEILAPALLLISFQWVLVAIAVGWFAPGHGAHTLSFGLRVAFGVALALILPWLDFIALLIQNAAVLVFPSWAHLGPAGQGGIEVLGQRLIFMVAQFLALLLALVPAGLVSLVVYFLIQLLAGVIPAVILAAAAGSLVLVAEVALGLWLLGAWFERFDLSTELTG